MADQRKKGRSASDKVVSFFAGKAIPGGPSSTSFEKVIQALRGVVSASEKKKKKKSNRSQAEKIFGDE